MSTLEHYCDAMLGIQGSTASLPDKIELPDSLAARFLDLYRVTEEAGKEHGCAIFYNDQARQFFFSPITQGGPFSMNITTSSFDNNIGNVHAHPSGSIGHEGGYCAHSMQDLLTFEKSIGKEFFFQFVVTGKKIYAMLYVQALSTFDDTLKRRANEWKDEITNSATNFVAKQWGGREQYMEKLASLNNQNQIDAFVDQAKRTTPGFGEHMEKLSLQACADIAAQFHYGFYINGKFFDQTLYLQ